MGLGLHVPHDLEGTSPRLAYARAVLKAYGAEDVTIERAPDLMRGTFLADALWGAIS